MQKAKAQVHGPRPLRSKHSTVINAVANAKETLAFSQHNSLAAEEPYCRTGHKTEMAKFKALGLLKDSRFDHRVVVRGGPSSVIVHTGNKNKEEGPPAAATAKPQEDDEDGNKDEGVKPQEE